MKITHKLTLFITFSLLSFISIILISINNTNNYKNKDRFIKIERYISKASKDYTLFQKRKNISLIYSYNKNLNSSKTIFESYNMNRNIKIIRNKIDSLRDFTNITFDYWVKRGLNENNGYEEDFRVNVHKLEDLLKEKRLSQFTINMLQIRRNEKDFIVRRNNKYVENVVRLTDQLIQNTFTLNIRQESKDSIVKLSNNYKNKFIKLVKILNIIDERNSEMIKMESELSNIISNNINKIDFAISEFSKIVFLSYILLFFSLLFISFVMYKRILTPISTLIVKTKNISNGNNNEIVNYEKKDEIGEFANSFNTMVRKFRSSQNDLENLNYRLESKVSDRTQLLQKKVEMRRLSEKKLEKYNNEINSLLNKEKELNKLKTQFVATVSHEYRTPLTVILNSTYLVENYALKNDFSSLKNSIEKIQFSVIQMKDILEDTLNYGKIENSKYNINLSNFNLNKQIINILQDFKTINKNRDIKLLYNSTKEMVYSDKKAVHHCLNNLISNAVKYSVDQINIQVFNDDEYIYISN